MKFIAFVFLGIVLTSRCFGAHPNSICLNMIVKDEKDVIVRCLESVKPIIDYWVIVDTGSSDGTQELIQNFLRDIPGELHESPWVNFEQNRNQALDLAKNKADYILFIDADEKLIFDEGFSKKKLDKDFYYISCLFSGTKYMRVHLIKNQLNWRWKGVLHEALECEEAKTSDILLGVTNFITSEGNRSKDPLKYQKDAEILEKALALEPNNARYCFYLAQSYRDAQMFEKALENYEKRVLMGGWDQEVFWSLLQIGLMQEALKESLQTIIATYQKAFEFRPTRAEPLYRMAHLHRIVGNYIQGYQVAQKGLSLRSSTDILFVENWIYDYGLLLEFSICAYWLEKYTEAQLASYLILVNANSPQNIRECILNNLVWIYSKLIPQHHMMAKESVTSENIAK